MKNVYDGICPEDIIRMRQEDEESGDSTQLFDTLKPALDILNGIQQQRAIELKRQRIIDNTKHTCLVCGHEILKGHSFCSKACEYEHHSLEDGCRHNREEEREEKQ